jgi:hypothetical protein
MQEDGNNRLPPLRRRALLAGMGGIGTLPLFGGSTAQAQAQVYPNRAARRAR